MSLVEPISWLRAQAGYRVLPLLDGAGHVTGLHTHRVGSPDSNYIDIAQVWHLHHAVAARIPNDLNLEKPGWPYPPLQGFSGPVTDVLEFVWSTLTHIRP